MINPLVLQGSGRLRAFTTLPDLRLGRLTAVWVAALGLWLAGAGWAAGSEVISTASLIEEMTDLAGMAELPQPPYTCKQFSSYDRKSKSPTEDWFANADVGQYLRKEVNGGREEFDYGPLGRLTRWDGKHPAVMAERIRSMSWADTLRESDPTGMARRQRHKDERFKYRLLTGITRLTGVDLNHTNHGRVLKV